MGIGLRIGILLLCGGLAACGTRGTEQAQGPLLPMPAIAAAVDPDDGLLMAAIGSYVAQAEGPALSQFDFTRIDLDGDGRREGLVMMKSPYHFWCGVHGCRMALFHARDDGFDIISEIAPVRGPITVSTNKTRGWRDLMVVVDGRSGWDRKQVALQFDGRAYPAAPELLPATYAAHLMADEGVRIFP